MPSVEKSLEFKKVLFPLRPIRAGLKMLIIPADLKEEFFRGGVVWIRVSFFEKNEKDTVDALVTKADEEISKWI